jgi:hypothetical protein
MPTKRCRKQAPASPKRENAAPARAPLLRRPPGNGRLEAQCIDGTKRLCHIRGKMRKKVWVNTVRAPTHLPPQRGAYPLSLVAAATNNWR